MLVHGKCTGQWDPVHTGDDAGHFSRRACRFGNRVTTPGVEETVNIDPVKAGYYSIRVLNPSGIVPAGPALPGTLSNAA